MKEQQHQKHPKTIAVDFDGVIHSYHEGWKDGTIYGHVIPGCVETLQQLLDHGFEVVIYSTRTDSKEVNGVLQSGQLAEMYRWLKLNNVPFTRIHYGVGKPLSVAFIDDNAIRFTAWDTVVAQLNDHFNSKL